MSEYTLGEMRDKQAAYEATPVAGELPELSNKELLTAEWRRLSTLKTQVDLVAVRLGMENERDEAERDVDSLVLIMPPDIFTEDPTNLSPEQRIEVIEGYIIQRVAEVERDIIDARAKELKQD